MTLASGNDIKIGSYEFRLDESVDAGSKSMALYRPHYVHTKTSLFSQRVDITGTPGKQQLRPERLVWFMDDWSGGENNRIFYADDPTVYSYGLSTNPRIRGQVTGRPTRTILSNLATDHIESKVFLAYANKALWYAGGYDIGFSTAATPSFTRVTGNTNTDGTDLAGIQSLNTSHRITAVAGDANYLYYATWHSGSSGTRALLAKVSDNTTEAETISTNEITAVPPYAGLCIMNGRLYGWTGHTLWEHDVFNPFPLLNASAYEQWKITINHLSGTDSFKLTCNGQNTAAFVRGTNILASQIQSAIRSAWTTGGNWTTATVTGGPAGQNPTANVVQTYIITASALGDLSSTPVTVTSVSGCTGTAKELTRGYNAGTGGNGINVRQVAGSNGREMLSTDVLGTTWWADCVAGEDSIFYFFTTDGISTVYEYVSGTPTGTQTPIFHAPPGFSVKSIRYQSGILHIGGHWGGDTTNTGVGALYAYPVDTRRPTPIGFVRKQNALSLRMDVSAGSYDNQVLFADSSTGRIFAYDGNSDGISCLDILETDSPTEGTPSTANPAATDALSFAASTKRIGSMFTYGKYRYAVMYNPSSSGAGNYDLAYYNDDEPANRQPGTATNSAVSKYVSGVWDYDLPFQTKALMGFDVTFDPTTILTGASSSILIEYSRDSGAWETGGTIDSTTTGYTNGRAYITIASGSSTPVFTNIQVRATLTGAHTTSPYTPPILLGLATEAQLIDYEETWDLIIRIKDPVPGTRGSTVSTMTSASVARDYLWKLVSDRAIVTFLDGYRYFYDATLSNAADGTTLSNAGYTTHNVMLENPEEIMIKKGESSFKLVLRAVPN